MSGDSELISVPTDGESLVTKQTAFHNFFFNTDQVEIDLILSTVDNATFGMLITHDRDKVAN